MTQKVGRGSGRRRVERTPLLPPAKPEVRQERRIVVGNGLADGERGRVEFHARVWRAEVVLPPDYYLG